MEIKYAEINDAPLIADAIIEAVGKTITEEFAGDRGVETVRRMFTRLAERDDSQYSYRNTLKCVDEDGNTVGVTVSYDGANLHRLRKAFFEEAKIFLNKDMEGNMPDETIPGEIYLDTLAVFAPYRRKGYAKALLNAMRNRSREMRKPLGLLVDKSNTKARKLYESIGFKKVGETMFASELMDHMQVPFDEDF